MTAVAHLELRRRATQATRDKYIGKPIDWAHGRHCAAMARFQLRGLGVKVPMLPRVRSVLGARRALDAKGWSDCAAMLDGVGLVRIAPAQMLIGDLAVLPSTDRGDGADAADLGLGSIVVCTGPQQLMGWFANAPQFVVMNMALDQLAGAWRVLPLPIRGTR